MGDWRLLSNHGRVLVHVAREPSARLRDIADAVGITERSAHRIVSDLADGGYLIRRRKGRSNNYEVRRETPIYDPLLGDHQVGEILSVVAPNGHGNDNGSITAAASRRRRG